MLSPAVGCQASAHVETGEEANRSNTSSRQVPKSPDATSQEAIAVLQTAMKNPNFAKMAESYHIRGIRCDHKADVEKTVKEMLDHKGPVVVDFYVEPNEHVYPMVPSGKGLHEMEMGTLA